MPGFESTMHEFAEGRLRSGKSNRVVTDPKQAIAIAYRVSGGHAGGDTAAETERETFKLPPSLASLASGPRTRRFEKLQRLGVPVAGNDAK